MYYIRDLWLRLIMEVKIYFYLHGLIHVKQAQALVINIPIGIKLVCFDIPIYQSTAHLKPKWRSKRVEIFFIFWCLIWLFNIISLVKIFFKWIFMLSCIYGMHQGEFEFQMFEIMIQYSIFCFVLIIYVRFFCPDYCLRSQQKSTRYVTFIFLLIGW